MSHRSSPLHLLSSFVNCVVESRVFGLSRCTCRRGSTLKLHERSIERILQLIGDQLASALVSIYYAPNRLLSFVKLLNELLHFSVSNLI